MIFVRKKGGMEFMPAFLFFLSFSPEMWFQNICILDWFPSSLENVQSEVSLPFLSNKNTSINKSDCSTPPVLCWKLSTCLNTLLKIFSFRFPWWGFAECSISVSQKNYFCCRVLNKIQKWQTFVHGQHN